MTNQIDALKLALEAHQAMREWIDAVPDDTVLPAMPGCDRDWLDTVEAAIKKALAARQEHEPENEPFVSLASVQEPVAWRKFNGFRFDYIEHQPALSGMVSKEWKPLYDTTPPAAAVQEGRDWSLLEATQESLREHIAEIKRLKEAQPAPVQEPVGEKEISAWAERHDIQGTPTDLRSMFEDAASFTTPPAAQPAPVQEPLFKVGNLVTLTGGDYPGLGQWFVQLWDGDEVAARVYGDDREAINRRIAALNTPHAQPAPVQPPTIEDNSQDWAGMDGVTAWHLIDRHADGWADVAKMMGEWLAANTPPAQPAPVQEPVATVIEELEHDGEGFCAKVRWLYNPVPVGETLSWEQPK